VDTQTEMVILREQRDAARAERDLLKTALNDLKRERDEAYIAYQQVIEERDAALTQIETCEQTEDDDLDPEILLADGFDKAFIGVGERCSQPALAVYDRELCLKVLCDDGMSFEEAVEHFDYNVTGAWVGERTPMFVTRKRLKKT